MSDQLKIPEHILEKIIGPEEHYKKDFIDGWNARDAGTQKESDIVIDDLLKREGDLRKENKELKEKLKIAERFFDIIEDRLTYLSNTAGQTRDQIELETTVE